MRGQAAHHDDEEIVIVVEEEGGRTRVMASPSVSRVSQAGRRSSSNPNIRRVSIRNIPCEFEDGGVELVRAITEMTHQPLGWVLAGYREDNATIYLQETRVGQDVSTARQHLKDDQQQYLLVRLPIAGEVGKLSRSVLITWRGKDIPPIVKGKYHEHKDIVAKGNEESNRVFFLLLFLTWCFAMFDDVHASLVCNGDRRNINEELIVDRSSPLSGSHEL